MLTFSSEEDFFASEALASLQDDPIIFFDAQALIRGARSFLSTFPGKTLYAVKANDREDVLLALWRAGVKDFDVASINEISRLRQFLPDAELHYMNPIRGTWAIRKALEHYAITSFTVDCAEELDEILRYADDPCALNIAIRLDVPNAGSEMPLSGKFGTSESVGSSLLLKAHNSGARVGITFHVGSQCLTPQSYELAIKKCRKLVDMVGVTLNFLDVGGGFPSTYGCDVLPTSVFVAAITDACAHYGFQCELWCEPGRALVASSQTIAAKVLRRSGSRVFLSDGHYGMLEEVKYLGAHFPVRNRSSTGSLKEGPKRLFSIFGPTCDNVDTLGKLYINCHFETNDWVLFDNMGAYSNVLSSNFNGFQRGPCITLNRPSTHEGG